MAPPTQRRPQVTFDMACLRRAVREQRKVSVAYVSESGEETERTVWPMALAFFPPVWLLLAWCELRQDFRSFRVDRVAAIDFAEERYPSQPGRQLSDYLRREAERRIRNRGVLTTPRKTAVWEGRPSLGRMRRPVRSG